MEFTQQEKAYAGQALRLLSGQARVYGLKVPELVLGECPSQAVAPGYAIQENVFVLLLPERMVNIKKSHFELIRQIRYFFIGIGMSAYAHLKSNSEVARVNCFEFTEKMKPEDFLRADIDIEDDFGSLRFLHTVSSHYGGLFVAKGIGACAEYLKVAQTSERAEILMERLPAKIHLIEPRLTATKLFDRDQSAFGRLVRMTKRKELDELVRETERVLRV